MITQSIVLYGCTPEPLMSYLKALGVLRLLNDQKDPEIRAWWSGDTLQLQTTIDRESLIAFFLSDYVPTPIIAPWSGGSGFFKKDNKRFVDALSRSTERRCQPYAQVIQLARDILANEKITDKPSDELKASLLRQYRRKAPEPLVEWMDAAMVLEHDGAVFAPVLGTGGNDGRLDFTQNFMSRLVTLGIPSGATHPNSREWLTCSLFGPAVEGLQEAAVGQFAPGRAGGPNATQGMEGSALDNPWDFVLMLEGSLVLAGAAVRRLAAGEISRSAFPFTVRPVGAGYGSASDNDETQSRGEIWLPIWKRPAAFAEIQNVFAEGRAALSARTAQTGLDFARAVTSLGVDRGFNGFHRYGFLKRSGKAYLASPLGRFHVREQAEIDLLREIDPWLDRFRRAATSKDAPARFHSTLHRIEETIFDVSRYGGSRFIEVVRALGSAERQLATGERWRNSQRLQPLGKLSTLWLEAANDGSIEFELALALAGIHDQKIGSLRSNLEPVEEHRTRVIWTDQNKSIVWNASDLSSNLADVLQRRMLDGEREGCSNLPLGSRHSASLGAIAAFLEGSQGTIDEAKMAELLWGLVLVDQRQTYLKIAFAKDRTSPLPRAYALLKLLFLPGPLTTHQGTQVRVCPESRVLSLLRSGRIAEACEIATRRLRSSRLTPMRVNWKDVHRMPGSRLAAALLVAVDARCAEDLLKLVIRPESLSRNAVA